MERIALISDIHGAVGAFEAVLGEAEGAGIDRFWCLGDSIDWLLPWLPSQRGNPEALRRVLVHCEHVLSGNHEQAMLADPIGRLILDQQPDGRKLIATLAGLPSREQLELGGVTVELVHGSPTDPVWGFIDAVDDMRKAFAASEAQLLCCGHTHRPLVALLKDGSMQLPDLPLAPAKYALGQDRVLVNPGAVVGGRDGIASWAVLELDCKGAPSAVSFRRTRWRPAALLR